MRILIATMMVLALSGTANAQKSNLSPTQKAKTANRKASLVRQRQAQHEAIMRALWAAQAEEERLAPLRAQLETEMLRQQALQTTIMAGRFSMMGGSSYYPSWSSYPSPWIVSTPFSTWMVGLPDSYYPVFFRGSY